MPPRERAPTTYTRVWVLSCENGDESSIGYDVAASELLTEDTVLRRVQGAMSYKSRTRPDVSKEVNGNPWE
jgi:hypothetical protein